eukprot:403354768
MEPQQYFNANGTQIQQLTNLSNQTTSTSDPSNQQSTQTSLEDFKDMLETISGQKNRTQSDNSQNSSQTGQTSKAVDEFLLITGSFIIISVSAYILYNTMRYTFSKSKKSQKNKSEEQNIKEISQREKKFGQGVMYKRLFLLGLFITSITRTFTLIFDTALSLKMGDLYPLSYSRMSSEILLELPTLLMMSTFSVFIYYFAKLTMQVEGQKSGKSILIPYDPTNLNNKEGFDEKRVLLLQQNNQEDSNTRRGSQTQSTHSQTQYKSNMNGKRSYMPYLVKVFFIVINMVTYIAYMIISIYYANEARQAHNKMHEVSTTQNTDIKLDEDRYRQHLNEQMQKNLTNSTLNSLPITTDQNNSTYQINSSYLSQFIRAISGLNGVMYLMLALAILNYGSRLETLITVTKSQGGGDDSSKRNQRRLTNNQSSHYELHTNSETNLFFRSMNEQSKKLLRGLDQRIFLITICLSMLFFVISICEFLAAWDVIQISNARWKTLLFIIITETIPSVILTHYMTQSGQKKSRRRKRKIDKLHDMHLTDSKKLKLDIRQSESEENSGFMEDDEENSNSNSTPNDLNNFNLRDGGSSSIRKKSTAAINNFNYPNNEGGVSIKNGDGSGSVSKRNRAKKQSGSSGSNLRNNLEDSFGSFNPNLNKTASKQKTEPLKSERENGSLSSSSDDDDSEFTDSQYSQDEEEIKNNNNHSKDQKNQQQLNYKQGNNRDRQRI